MSALETRIPPPVVMIIAGLLALALDLAGLDWSPLSDGAGRVAGFLVAVAGVGFSAAGLRAFTQAETTFDPHKIDEASTVVTTGVYRLTRNPMYIGLTLVLCGWCLGIGTWIGLGIGGVALVAYLTRFQIVPEERMLTEKFGQLYLDYRSSVRRWI